MTAWWHGEDPAQVTAHGCLVVDSQGGVPEQVPLTTGTVVRVGVVEQTYRRSARPVWVPVPGGFNVRSVTRSPRWFHEKDPLPDGADAAYWSGRTIRSVCV